VSRPKQYPTLKEYLDSASNIPIDDGGLLAPDDVPEYTPEGVIKDAQTILRLEEAAEPGGPLSFGICSVYEPEEQLRPPEQYAHLDHLNRAAIEFRKLMTIEQRKHRATAKRLAEACRDEWYRKQPKTKEQLEAEEAKGAEARYKSVVKTLQATWDNVKAEVNRRRLLEWEAQEQARVRKALNEAVDLSTQKLEARRAQRDSEVPSDEDDSDRSDEDGESDSESEGRESNMSSSDSEADEDQPKIDAAEDEHLTVEQLREKYASLPSIAPASADEGLVEEDEDQESRMEKGPHLMDLEDTFDDSDESVDMDDDMGSSDEDRDSDDDDESDEDEDEDGPGESSLLGFLPDSDLKATEVDEPDPATPTQEGADLAEDDEVLVVPDEWRERQPTSEGVVDTPDILSESTGTAPASTLQIPEVTAASPDRSSQPTPRTTDTRISEIDSASSVEPHQNSRQVTQSATPQPSSKARTPIPFLLRGTLREYQHDGLDWLAGQYAANTNGILADEMGLGKTIQTIALLAHLACEHEVWGPHLVIVPTSVMLNWEMEFKKWCPGFKILTYYGTQEERKRKRLGWKSEDAWNVCITSYQLVIQDQQVFKRRRWHYMILDEAHNIKNFQSQRWQTMLTFNTRARLLLTGTPLQNNLTELWSLLYFLAPPDMAAGDGKPGGFTNLKDFQDWFKKPSEQILEHGRDQMDDESKAIITKLHQVLRPYLLRRLKADVEKQMPGKYEHVEFCRLSKRQRELYDSFLSREDTRGTLASGNYLSIINCLMQLRKVCNHPDLFLDRPIMTSFPMEKSAVADFEIKELLVRRRLLSEDPMTKASLNFLNLVPADHERLSDAVTARSAMLNAQRKLMDLREAQRARAQNALTNLDPSTAKSNLVYLESASRWGRFEELQHCVYLNALRRQQKPIYGTQLVELLTLGVNDRPLRPQPKRKDRMLTWLHNTSPTFTAMVPTIASRSRELNTTLQKFACVTPPVIARDMTSLVMTAKVVNTFRSAVTDSKPDPFHEARMRLSIQFPDKRLLQYDCGKLQTLAKLLRKLQAGGHRALIFTQMTKVLDILEQFLNIHGHKYLRLDGSTKIEQRQILTDRFNNDTRILAFILSSRSGGLGINLTGADTVIFYDLDWNPAMDKQCQDRCHRIGQTRDVHIYRLVSEHTIEANILRKANQKRMLDDVVIQEGEFTTDYFNKMSVRDVLGEDSDLLDGDAAANAAMDRVLGGPDSTKDVSRVLAQAEDVEDVAAARVAAREIVQTDAADFDENAVTASATPAGPQTPRDGLPTPAGEGTPALDDAMDLDGEDELNAWGEQIESTDEYMLKFMAEQLKDTPVELPKDRNRSKRVKDHRSRSHRMR
jgi:helicase SWR1